MLLFVMIRGLSRLIMSDVMASSARINDDTQLLSHYKLVHSCLVLLRRPCGDEFLLRYYPCCQTV